MCHHIPGTHHGPTLWAGTNSGSVYAYALEVPGVGLGRVCDRVGASETSLCVEAVLGKEIQLMHRAPVVSISVLDGRGKPLPEPYEASQDLAIAPDMTNAHSVLIASEEQLKVQITRIKTSVRNIQTHLHLYFLLCLPRCSLFLRSAPKQSSS